jgi:hypothetical protein
LLSVIQKYGIDLTNEWAGGTVKIDEEEATIMATAMGAGVKHSDNSFSGVLMGSFSKNGKIYKGLYGFN